MRLGYLILAFGVKHTGSTMPYGEAADDVYLSAASMRAGLVHVKLFWSFRDLGLPEKIRASRIASSIFLKTCSGRD
jgi:hypothetical protein